MSCSIHKTQMNIKVSAWARSSFILAVSVVPLSLFAISMVHVFSGYSYEPLGSLLFFVYLLVLPAAAIMGFIALLNISADRNMKGVHLAVGGILLSMVSSICYCCISTAMAFIF